MSVKVLFVLLEGPTDEKFFSNILKTHLDDNTIVRPWQYSRQRKAKTLSLIRSIESMKAKSLPWDYIYSKDFNGAICLTEKRNNIIEYFSVSPTRQIIAEERMIIVVEEIESWYLAGVSRNFLLDLGVKKWINMTDNVTKEKFVNFIPKRMPDLVFRSKIVADFDVELAKNRNRSFGYFWDKILPNIFNSNNRD